jgi:hypothetical protein
VYLRAYSDVWETEVSLARFLWMYCHVRIEYNLDVIRYSGWIIDIAPEGRDKQSDIAGISLDDVVTHPARHSGRYFKQALEQYPPSQEEAQELD